MKISNFGRSVFGVVLAAAVVAGCSGSQPMVPGTTRPSDAIRMQARNGSWMLQAAKSQNLLYVTDSGSNSVYVYSFPGGTRVGTLTGLSSPQGDCVDASQNVWIANTGTKELVEYAHGGTSPIATLADSGTRSPFACAVDPGTGNLAVTNADHYVGEGRGDDVVIYRNAQGTPHKYRVGSPAHLFYDGYDNQGNLFVDGLTRGNRRYGPRPGFAELAKNSNAFAHISIFGGAFYPRPGGVQWDGKHITVMNVNVIYRLRISGDRGTVVGSSTLQGTYNSDVDATSIAGNYVAASMSDPASQNWGVGIWKYPSGNSVATLKGTFSRVPGVAVSLAE